MEFLFETVEDRKVRKWARVVAFVKLMSAVTGIYLHFVIEPGIVDESSHWFDVFDFYFNTAAELMIFAGLWHFKPWGWKAAVLLIPISYLFSLIVSQA